ncbi:MAG TPA: MBL fold metallo-hydrolase [Desulfuromonadales bacterium]|nr:MBL fold metallo-hydrolase [Desulfuromonadales bacterium]
MSRTGLLIIWMLLMPVASSAAHFSFKNIQSGVYAAIAEPGCAAESNAMIVVTRYQVILAGAHFTRDTTRELLDFIKTVTPIPVRYIILTHHHRGSINVDLDLPRNIEIIVSGPTWSALKSEPRQIANPVTIFDRYLTIKRESVLLVLNATERAHTTGDVFVYLPEEGVLFTSDLVFNSVVGAMGEGAFRNWSNTLEMLVKINARSVIPGLGAVTTTDGIVQFQTFFRAFTTEILQYTNKDIPFDTAKSRFSLKQYESLPGFKRHFDRNFKRAYDELKALK